ncbi:MAG TPA: Hsp33 family molecular chaperone HslO [Porticoccaceae bacterium]|nr:Hsp33 family molecular chaperone HslO [Porticoccaceae bacterium]
MSTPDRDQRQRFLFEHSDIRGEILSLESSYQTTLSKANYPPAIARLLGEFLAGACLLSGTLKFEGSISLQASGRGSLRLIMAECSHHQNIRAIAQTRPDPLATSLDEANAEEAPGLKTLLGANATLAVTINPERGERYQGIIPIESDSLSQCLESYFRQSEQLATGIWLSANGQRAAGLLIQALPEGVQSTDAREEHWRHLCHLASTLSAQEQLELSHNTILHRLFHEQSLRLFTPAEMSFSCTCSSARTLEALASFGKEELQAMLAETNPVEVTCQFCHHHYHFTRADIESAFKSTTATMH